jgi:hypothetical protein
MQLVHTEGLAGQEAAKAPAILASAPLFIPSSVMVWAICSARPGSVAARTPAIFASAENRALRVVDRG